MPSYVLYAHGGRQSGTSSGTYVIPRGITVYFFETDTEYLYDSAAQVIMNTLLVANPDELAVQAIAKETKQPYETIPNYEASGDPNIAGMGLYIVGQTKPAGQVYAIPHGTKKRISDIIGGGSKGGVIGTALYWLACRAAPRNSNVFVFQTKDTVMTSTGAKPLNAETGTSVSGLKPSVVRTIGNWRR